jgi:hypothetical protein
MAVRYASFRHNMNLWTVEAVMRLTVIYKASGPTGPVARPSSFYEPRRRLGWQYKCSQQVTLKFFVSAMKGNRRGQKGIINASNTAIGLAIPTTCACRGRFTSLDHILASVTRVIPTASFHFALLILTSYNVAIAYARWITTGHGHSLQQS